MNNHSDDRPEQHSDEAVCWLLDVRKYGIAIANELHSSRASL